jgi:hypothetical protein
MPLDAVCDVAYSVLLARAETNDRHNAAVGGSFDDNGDPVATNVDSLHQFLGMTDDDDEGEDADVIVLATYSSNQALAERLLAPRSGPGA